MTLEQAKELTVKIQETAGLLTDLCKEAFLGKIWEPMGYDSWEDYCRGEFVLKFKLPVPERRTAVRELSDAGMTTRQVGAALGITHTTVVRDLGTNVPGPNVPGPTTFHMGGERFESYPGREAMQVVFDQMITVATKTKGATLTPAQRYTALNDIDILRSQLAVLEDRFKEES